MPYGSAICVYIVKLSLLRTSMGHPTMKMRKWEPRGGRPGLGQPGSQPLRELDVPRLLYRQWPTIPHCSLENSFPIERKMWDS